MSDLSSDKGPSKPSIVFFANASSIHTKKWVDYFVNAGYTVALVSFSKTNITNAAKVYSLGGRSMKIAGVNVFYLFSIFKLSKILKKERPDFFNAHFSYSLGFMAVVAKAISGISAKVSVVCHGTDVLCPPLPILTQRINKFTLHRCDNIFAVSDQIHDKIIEMGVPQSKVHTGQYGVEVLSPVKLKDIDIISNRSYVENSRIEFLLEKISNTVKDASLKAVFVLSNIKDVDYNRLTGNWPDVTFYKDIRHNEMLQLVARSKVYVSATKSDGASLSLLEAMGAGCIPVVSNIAANRSWLVDGLNGYLFSGDHDFAHKLNSGLEAGPMMATHNVHLIKHHALYSRQMSKIEKLLVND